MGLVDELERLAELRQLGRITDPEYESAKTQLLATSGPITPTGDASREMPYPEDGPRGFNWGAFLITPFWGMAHRSPHILVALAVTVALYPFAGDALSPSAIVIRQLLSGAWLVLSVVAGLKGNAWGWQTHGQTSGGGADYRRREGMWAGGGGMITLGAAISIVMAIGGTEVPSALAPVVVVAYITPFVLSRLGGTTTKWAGVLYALTGGVVGLHRFYLGHRNTGLRILGWGALTAGGFGVILGIADGLIWLFLGSPDPSHPNHFGKEPMIDKKGGGHKAG